MNVKDETLYSAATNSSATDSPFTIWWDKVLALLTGGLLLSTNSLKIRTKKIMFFYKVAELWLISFQSLVINFFQPWFRTMPRGWQAATLSAKWSNIIMKLEKAIWTGPPTGQQRSLSNQNPQWWRRLMSTTGVVRQSGTLPQIKV